MLTLIASGERQSKNRIRKINSEEKDRLKRALKNLKINTSERRKIKVKAWRAYIPTFMERGKPQVQNRSIVEYGKVSNAKILDTFIILLLLC